MQASLNKVQEQATELRESERVPQAAERLQGQVEAAVTINDRERLTFENRLLGFLEDGSWSVEDRLTTNARAWYGASEERVGLINDSIGQIEEALFVERQNRYRTY